MGEVYCPKKSRRQNNLAMENEKITEMPSRGTHVLVLPYPLQGHINPMLQFSKRLASKGLKVTLLTTTSISTHPIHSQTDVEIVRISDGFHVGDKVDDTDAKCDHFRASVSQSLLELIDHYKRNKLEPRPKMVIYNSFMPWALDVARKSGLKGASFVTQSCMVNYIYYNVYKGDLEIPVNGGNLVSLPAFNEFLKGCDMPTFVSSPSKYPSTFLRVTQSQFPNFEAADCVLVNTVDKLEIEVVKWMASQWQVKTIGPTIPSMYLDRRLLDDKEYGLSLFKLDANSCMPWLDSQESGSVVYVAMGSMASLGHEQMEELAMGLEKCNKHFLWVVRSSEENKLPLHFKDKTSKFGLIVNWCPQLEVLAHRAVGCFVTHCGWNSTLEAISLGVPMVGFPHWSDQPTNSKCISDFWRVGVRVTTNENGIVSGEEIKVCIQQVMEGEKGEEIKRNARKLKQVVREAMNEGGSSDSNIEELVAELLAS